MNSEQFTQKILTESKFIYQYIIFLVPNASDAEDILQETTLIMWRKLDTYDDNSSFVGWGRGIARNCIRNFWRKKRRMNYLGDDLVKLIEEESFSGGNNETQQEKLLQECIQLISKNERKMLFMRYEKGSTLKEIACNLGMSINMTFRKLARIHDTLARCIGRKISEN
ncbi:sigma-70 family RNA polymerase sigma factor [Sedimentisphaera salicampi]|uniref:RNA polymerase sigma factor SigM n=1 Tax=Sedimentisphaera salicampi TaxID=1941349 RepID=A0A1W6LNZ9_9BACT|nr:sigma-70 family RNA polymerase sigma factor [Sedimentisphaera salicampi]ARN57481.1 RNA polymerase sigma factor SigM [Sedimentisphaera salicampi]